MAEPRLFEYLTDGKGGKLPGHAKDELIWASDEIERLRSENKSLIIQIENALAQRHTASKFGL